MFRKRVIRFIRQSLHIRSQSKPNFIIRESSTKPLSVIWENRMVYQIKVVPHSIRRSRNIHVNSLLLEVVEVKAPNFPDSVTTGDAKLLKKEGDAVAMDEIVMEIETDKTALPVMSPGHGKLVKFLVQEGQPVKSQQPCFQVDVTGEAPAAAPAPAKAAPAPTPAAAPVAAPAPPAPAAASPPAPATATAAAPAKVDIITKKAPAGPTPAAQRKLDPATAITGTRHEHPVPMNKMRKRIAERLKEAQNTTAMLTTFNECDMSKLMEFRKANLKEFTKKYGVKLSFMSPFIKASANALLDQPVINGFIHGDNIIYRDYVDISIAVATPRGLVVPVLRNVDGMDFPQIELSMNALAEKARTGKLTPADMQGGTFTISNGGVFGSLLSMPIINLPQSAILGMHATFQRPVAINGKVEIRPMMYLALSYDHRLIDGREAVMFLRKIKSGVEDPTSILAGM